jgi:hypothetical protein
MKQSPRTYPLFSLCGLNCGLCPRFHTDGVSKCPGCGGPDFHLKHPTCAVITCNKKHDNVEFCFHCSSYPCEKYSKPGQVDSFISYRNVISDLKNAKGDMGKYKKDLNEKVSILKFLIKNYNDGKRKNFYCISVNLLKLADLKKIMKQIDKNANIQRDKVRLIVGLFEEKAKKENIALKLRK